MSRIKPTAPATPSYAPAVRLTPPYRARPRRREFLIVVVTEEILRPSGLGLTLSSVIADMVDTFASAREMDTHAGPDEYIEYGDDQVVWEGNRVVAVVRADRDGLGLEVVRFDGGESAGPA